jgi:arylsulfatase A
LAGCDVSGGAAAIGVMNESHEISSARPRTSSQASAKQATGEIVIHIEEVKVVISNIFGKAMKTKNSIFPTFLSLVVIFSSLSPIAPAYAKQSVATKAPTPNIIILLADDLAFGDLGVNGNRLVKTPNIDRMAGSGLNFSQFYASANVCSPSRAGMMTGRYPIRTGLAHNVLSAHDHRGLPEAEETIGELAQRGGYNTMYVGKWHLGQFAEHPNFSPTRNGFAKFFGVPHSNDMEDFALYDGERRIEYPIDQVNLTTRYTQKAVDFIAENAGRPFLLYVAYNAPHIPLYPPADMAGRSAAGTYGDVVEELDRSVGRIREALRAAGTLDNTVIFITSDNGPFFEGDTAGLKGAKGSTYEGGYRVPLVLSWPRQVRRARINAITMNIDIFPTVADLIRVAPANAVIDGKSLVPLFRDRKDMVHDYLYLFNNEDVVGVRSQRWKYLTHVYYRGSFGAFEKFAQIPNFQGQYDLLFPAENPDGESYSLANLHPEATAELKKELARARAIFAPFRTRAPVETYPR